MGNASEIQVPTGKPKAYFDSRPFQGQDSQACYLNSFLFWEKTDFFLKEMIMKRLVDDKVIFTYADTGDYGAFKSTSQRLVHIWHYICEASLL